MNDTNQNLKQVKEFYNVEHFPIFHSKKDMKVIDLCPPPPLHLIKLGPVNKVYGELAKRLDLTQFEKSINITKEQYHSGEYEGYVPEF